jgi:hypothetical protein
MAAFSGARESAVVALMRRPAGPGEAGAVSTSLLAALLCAVAVAVTEPWARVLVAAGPVLAVLLAASAHAVAVPGEAGPVCFPVPGPGTVSWASEPPSVLAVLAFAREVLAPGRAVLGVPTAGQRGGARSQERWGQQLAWSWDLVPPGHALPGRASAAHAAEAAEGPLEVAGQLPPPMGALVCEVAAAVAAGAALAPRSVYRAHCWPAAVACVTGQASAPRAVRVAGGWQLARPAAAAAEAGHVAREACAEKLQLAEWAAAVWTVGTLPAVWAALAAAAPGRGAVREREQRPAVVPPEPYGGSSRAVLSCVPAQVLEEKAGRPSPPGVAPARSQTAGALAAVHGGWAVPLVAAGQQAPEPVPAALRPPRMAESGRTPGTAGKIPWALILSNR